MPVRRSRLHHALAALLCLAGGGVLLTTWGCEAGGDGAADAAADAHAEVSLDAAADAQVGDTGPQDSGDAEDAPSDLAGGETTPTDGEGDTPATTPPPMIQDALADACKPNAKHGTGVTPGTDLVRVSLAAYPDAVCNDGTPAILYVRGAADQAHANEWLFHLQGGGSCWSYDECRDRWCSEGVYQRSKMTSSLAPAGMKAAGIFARTDPDGAVNPAAAGNQVWVYYCSSDIHIGQKDDVVFPDPAGTDVPATAGAPFRMYRRGHTIIEATVAALKAGLSVNEGEVQLPSLDQATLVFFTGTSGGSAGAQANLDWFAAQLPPAARVVGIFDAAFPFDRELVDNADVQALLSDAATPAAWTAKRAREDRFIDASCMAFHGDDPWRCGDPSHVVKHHITTPFFVRHDLLDPPTLKATGPYVEDATAVGWTHQSLVNLGDVSTAEEAAAMTRTPGVFSQACAQHVGITNTGYTFVAQLEDPDGVPRTFMDALTAWFGGMDVALIQTLDAPHLQQTCPPTSGAVD